MNSKQKGARGERMLAALLTDAGFPARRGVQYHGGSNSPDIRCPDLERWHWEAKFTEQARLRDWLAQVEADSAGKPWIISWKRRFGPWLAIVKLDTLLDIIRDSLPPAKSISALLPASCDADNSAEPQSQASNEIELKGPVMKLTEAFPSKWLKAADLDGQPRLVTIESVKLESVEEGKPAKPVVVLRGMTQGLVLNKTNGNTLAGFLGDDTDTWTGKKIVLFPTQAEFQGRMTDCIRVRAPKPQAAAPAPAAVKPVAAPATPSKAAEEVSPIDNSDDVPF